MVEPISAGIIAGGSLLNGLLGAGASMGSAYQQYKYQKKLQQQSASLNYKYSKKLTKWQQQKTPTYTRQGLESAGYNPILALGTQIGSAGTSFTGTGNATAPDFSQGLSSALDWANFYKDKKEVESRIENNEQDTKLKDQQAQNIMEDTYAKDVQNTLAYENAAADLDYKLIMNRLNVSSAVKQEIENGNLPEYWQKYLKLLDSQTYNNLFGSASEQTSARANYMNANTNAYDVRVNKPQQIQNQYDIGTNTRTNSIGIHGPLGIGVTVNDQGYKPKRSKKYK